MRNYADAVLVNNNGVMTPAAGASIQVVAHVSQINASLFSDDGITPTPNPLTADANGRFSFFVADGRYDLKFTGAFTSFTLSDIDIFDADDVTLSGRTPIVGNLTFTGGNLHSGAETFTGALQPKLLENVLYVDSLNSQGWAGATPDAWITSAMASSSCQSGGCTISLTGLASATTFAAPVVLPSAKPIRIQLGQVTITGPCPIFDASTAADGTVISGVSTGFIDATLGTTYGTKFVCSSGTDGIKLGSGGANRYSGMLLENFSINCNSQAARGLTLDTVQYSTIRNIQVTGCTSIGYWAKTTFVGTNNGTQFNQFSFLSAQNVPICFQADNSSNATSDFTQNYIQSLTCAYTGTAGVLLNGADNNWFYATRVFRLSGAGSGIVLTPPSAGTLVGGMWNWFYGIEGIAGVPSISAQSGTIGNQVYGYDFENGESFPLLGSGAPTSLIFNGSILSGSSTPPGSSVIDPGASHWLYAQGNCGNPPNSNPALPAGVALGYNFSNGLGEGDVLVNIGFGSGGGGLFRFYSWNGTTATLFATLPNSAIGNIVGDTGPAYTAVAFASLGTPANGTFRYCNDCTIANPCAGGGTGALAKRLNGVWVCN